MSVNFVSQSHLPRGNVVPLAAAGRGGGITIAEVVRCDRGLVALVEADAYPRSGRVRFDGLMPDRHYRVRAGGECGCRADAEGRLWVELRLTRPTLLSIVPLV